MELLSGSFTFRHVVSGRLFEVSGKCTGVPCDFGSGRSECHGVIVNESIPGIVFQEYLPERISCVYDIEYTSIIFRGGLITRIDYNVDKFKKQWPGVYKDLEEFFYSEMPEDCAIFEGVYSEPEYDPTPDCLEFPEDMVWFDEDSYEEEDDDYDIEHIYPRVK